MKEIGGYFQLEEFTGCEYYHSLLRLNTVRNAVEYIIEKRKYRKIFLPSYLCNSIRGMLERKKVNYDYYEIDIHFKPAFNHAMDRNECIIIVNYFGILRNEEIKNIQEKYKNIIVDNTQAFFQEPIQGIDTVYSCRKYFGVSDGAYLSTDCDCSDYCELPADMTHNRMDHLLGRAEESATLHYATFQQNEKSLSDQEVKKMSPITRNILKAIDYNRVREIRKNNFRFMHMSLAETNELNLSDFTGDFMYPFLYSEGEELKKRLIKDRVYIPTLWPNVLDECRREPWESYLARNLVCIPVDQRYGEMEMEYMVGLIKEYIH